LVREKLKKLRKGFFLTQRGGAAASGRRPPRRNLEPMAACSSTLPENSKVHEEPRREKRGTGERREKGESDRERKK